MNITNILKDSKKKLNKFALKSWCRKCDRKTKKDGLKYRLISEWGRLFISSEADYQNGWKEFCENDKYEIKLIYSSCKMRKIKTDLFNA